MKSGFAKQHLRSFIDRIERLEEERAAAVADIKEVYAEAKGHGFDTKVMREVVRIRRMDRADYEERKALLDLYLEAMQAGPEIAEAAREALHGLGDPVPVTEEERAKGVVAAFD